MRSDTVIKLAAWGVCIMVVLQLIFHFVFHIIGYDSLLLSITLVASILVVIIILAVCKVLKRQSETSYCLRMNQLGADHVQKKNKKLASLGSGGDF